MVEPKPHTWTRMRPYQENRELKARIVCRDCPAERRMIFRPEKKTWEEIGEGKGLKEACPITP
jgi:hypothetical protein